MAKSRLVTAVPSNKLTEVPAVGSDVSEPSAVLKRDAETEDALWRSKVLERSNHACGNCGGDVRLQVHFVVPPEAGGALVETNGYVLCRGCEMTREIANKRSASARRPINFWVSRHLYDLLDKLTQPGRRFSSMGELIRYLISFYLTSPLRFDDLPNYQDRGTDAKVNAWVAQDAYESFKSKLDVRGMTVTDALKGLILLYAEQEPVEPSNINIPEDATRDDTDE